MNHLKVETRKIHPIEQANILSKLFFLYTVKLYRKGFKRDLVEDDIYEVVSGFEAHKLGSAMEKQWETLRQANNLSIIKLLWRSHGHYYLFLGLLQFVFHTGLVVAQPFALGRLISHFESNDSQQSQHSAHFYGFLVIALNFANGIFHHNFNFAVIALSNKVRQGICSLIYRKALGLNPQTSNVSIGNMVTLMARDIDAFELFLDFGNDIWISLTKAVVICTILYIKVGIAAVVGVAVFFVVFPIQLYGAYFGKQLKIKTCEKTDRRLQLTQEILSAIKIIKIYTWELFLMSKITDARKKEVNAMFQISCLRTFNYLIGTLSNAIAFYLLLMTYIWMGNHVTAEVVYYIVTCFQTLSQDLVFLFPVGIYQWAELMAAIKRVGRVIDSIEIQEDNVDTPTDNKPILLPRIHIKNLTVLLSKDKKILDQVDLELIKGLTTLTGTVGSGKTVLLKTILQYFKSANGSLSIEGRISYASQEPWLFPSTIRQNILFGQPFDEERYREVVRVCALKYDLDILPQGDQTIVEDRGINLSKGQQCRVNLARAVYRQADIYLLDDCLSSVDGQVGNFIFEECIQKFLRDKLVVLVTHNPSHLRSSDRIVELDRGRVKTFGTHIDPKIIGPQESAKSNYLQDNLTEDDANEDSQLLPSAKEGKSAFYEVERRGNVERLYYKKYLQFGGVFWFVLAIVLAGGLQFVSSYVDKLISKWVNLEQEFSKNSTNSTTVDVEEKRYDIFVMYTTMTVLLVVSHIVRALCLLTFARNASLNMHDCVITNVVMAPMQFFDRHFIGNILNRFSYDLMVIDEWLPFTFSDVFRALLVLIGIVTLIATVNTTFLVPAVIFFIILVLLRIYCVRTARGLKRLQNASRSPVVGHLNATLEGLPTIRAFKNQSLLSEEFDRHQDLYTSANYTVMCSTKAFAFCMDMMSCIFIALVILRFIFGDKDSFLAGNVGLAITQASLLTETLQWGFRQWIGIENQMTSVERIMEFSKARPENNQGLVLDNWPKMGEIKFDKVNLSYRNFEVLKDISFTAEAGEKIGIVGRTGAGKSSIISTLFRLYDHEGKITIDGVDTKHLSLNFLRSKISIIPQDPVLFSGTIRENIDPIGEFGDEEIWRSLKTANLGQTVLSLSQKVDENGSNFSMGQRQLICLARAIVRDNKIIILDEATANMDPETDSLIHETIARNFADYTIITIAHKLHSIMKSGKIVVLDKGEIVEFDTPQNLRRGEGRFFNLVQESGRKNL